MTILSSHLAPIENILDVARWAPSGDNAQPWSFFIQGNESVELRIHTQIGNVYEYRDGEPTLISAGTLLENIEIASGVFGKTVRWEYRGRSDDTHLVQLYFSDRRACVEPELFSEIRRRTVDRRPYKLRRLPSAIKADLSSRVGEGWVVDWHETFADRRKIASLTRMATEIRLRIPETFEIHRRIVDWDSRESTNAIPSRALGLDPLTLKIMRWSMRTRARTELLNALGSPFFASLQMDLLPGIFSGAYFLIRADQRGGEGGPPSAVQLLKLGQAVQRLWLAASKAGLALQPCLAVLAFSHYGTTEEPFTTVVGARQSSKLLARRLGELCGEPRDILFMGRLGWPRGPVHSRSVRLSLSQLLDAA